MSVSREALEGEIQVKTQAISDLNREVENLTREAYDLRQSIYVKDVLIGDLQTSLEAHEKMVRQIRSIVSVFKEVDLSASEKDVLQRKLATILGL